MLSEKMRDEFEAWFDPDEDNRRSLRNYRTDDGYRLDAYYLNGCWNGYQAGAASRDAEVQRLREALEDTAQTLAWLAFGECRGFATSLLSNREALDKARAALKEQQ